MQMKVLKFIVIGLMFYACNGNNSSVSMEDLEVIEESKEKLLVSVTSDSKTKFFHYNNDSTLHAIKIERNGELESEFRFIYENNKVSNIVWKDAWDNSEVKRVLEYKENQLVKKTFLSGNDVLAIDEYFYDENNHLVKQIQKLEWDNDANKQTRVIDIHRVLGENEIQIKYDGVLTFILTYDDKVNPYSRIKGYSKIYATQNYGLVNHNITSFKRVYRNGEFATETSDLMFDPTGKYLLEVIKRASDHNFTCKEIYSYN
jgi:hypothetical protein